MFFFLNKQQEKHKQQLRNNKHFETKASIYLTRTTCGVQSFNEKHFAPGVQIHGFPTTFLERKDLCTSTAAIERFRQAKERWIVYSLAFLSFAGIRRFKGFRRFNVLTRKPSRT